MLNAAFDRYQSALAALILLYIGARCSIWLAFRYLTRAAPLLISYGGISLVGSDFVVTGLRVVKESLQVGAILDGTGDVYVDEIRVKWHNIIQYLSYRKPIRVKIRSIEVKLNVMDSINPRSSEAFELAIWIVNNLCE